MIYDHHTGDLTRRLDEVQHDYTAEIVSTMHVHLDHHNCLEILALRGKGERVYELADKLLALRGVKHGKLTCAATESSSIGNGRPRCPCSVFTSISPASSRAWACGRSCTAKPSPPACTDGC